MSSLVGSVIVLTFPSLLYSEEAVGKSFPKTASPMHLSFPVAGQSFFIQGFEGPFLGS